MKTTDLTATDILQYLKNRRDAQCEEWKFYCDKAYLRLNSLDGDVVLNASSRSIQVPSSSPDLYFTTIEGLCNILNNLEKYSSGKKYSDSYEYLELFYPFEPNDIWRMAITKSERKRVILNKIYDRLELYLSDLVERYQKELPSLHVEKWSFERRRHPKDARNSIAFYDPDDNTIHFSLSCFMYGELELRMTILHEMCHVKYLDHKPHFWNLLFDSAVRVGLSCASHYYAFINQNGKNQNISTPDICDYTQTIVKFPKNKSQNIFTEIPKHRYIKSSETNVIDDKATQLYNSINHADYLTEKYHKVKTSLWMYTSKGSLRAATLLTDLLGYAMKYHNMNELVLFYLTQEKMLNMGYHRLDESIMDNFNCDKEIERQYNQEQLDYLIEAGSGLALLNKGDILISQGKNLSEVIEFYKQAAIKGYSVGWRILYCIFYFMKDKKSADDALLHFTEEAPNDNTNWKWIEIFACDYRHKSFSIMSMNLQSAKRLLSKIYNHS